MPQRHFGRDEVQLLSFLTLALDVGEWSASSPSHFTPRVRATNIHWIRGWMGPGTSQDAVVKRKLQPLSLLGMESWSSRLSLSL